MTQPKKFWDKQHDFYAVMDWVNKPSLFAEWAITYFPKKGHILELGAGHGFDSLYFLENGYSIVSTDFSESALSYIKRKIPCEFSKVVRIEQLDLAQLFPYKDNSFDIVYSHLAIHYFSEFVTKQIFDEMYRVLKPGGIVALLTNSTSDPEYNTGKKIEENYFETANLYKRYFSVEAMRKYAHRFEEIVCDDKGSTYKDSAKEVYHLIRFIGRKG